MSDGFLTLAQTEGGLTCFLVPRWLEDGTRNAIHLMRLKDKLGNRANASAEIEFTARAPHLVGEEGARRTGDHRRWCITPGSTPRWRRPGLMRAALAEAASLGHATAPPSSGG
jgi:putative acyl-CoA dehydrogenase